MSATGPVATAAAPTAPRLAALDGVRGLAALAVLVTHVAFQTGRTGHGDPAAWLLSRLDIGVTVFFVLSGFLLWQPFVAAALEGRPAPSLRRYALRRAARVLPAYWALLVVVAVAVPAAIGDAGDAVRHLLLAQTYGAAALEDPLTQTWSLVVEVAFYVVLPLLAVLACRPGPPQRVLRRQAALVAALVLASASWSAAVLGGHLLPDAPSAQLWLPAYLDWFAVGMGVAVLHRAAALPVRSRVVQVLDEVRRAPGTCWGVAALFLVLASTPLTGPRLLETPEPFEWAARHVLYLAVAAFVLLAATTPVDDPVSRVLRSVPLRRLGTVSYALFLWHLLVLRGVLHLTGTAPFTGRFPLVLLVTLAVSLVVAGLSWVLLERPVLRAAHRWEPGRSAHGDRGKDRHDDQQLSGAGGGEGIR